MDRATCWYSGSGAHTKSDSPASERSQKENRAAAVELAGAGTPQLAAVNNEPSLIGVEYKGKPCTHVCTTVALPAGRAWSRGDVTVKAGIDSIHVCLQGCSPLAVPTNVCIKAESCSCTVELSCLTVTAEINPLSNILAVAEANRPLRLGMIDLQSRELVEELD
jgi:hypothetical protein